MTIPPLGKRNASHATPTAFVVDDDVSATWVISIDHEVRSLNSFHMPPGGESLSSLEVRH
jgi:hypothetical protein